MSETNEYKIEPVRQEPPGYPYPGEEIIFSSARNAPDFTLGEDSWFAVSKLDEEQTHVFNGREHRNPYRFVIHSPVAGSESFFIKHADAEALILAMLSVFADADQPGDHPNTARLSESFCEGMIADEYSVEIVR